MPRSGAGIDPVGFVTLQWVHWFNNQRLLEPIGYVPASECEETDYRGQSTPAEMAGPM